MSNEKFNVSPYISFIWGICDDCLRDVYVRGKYRDVILPMTVIRRLDLCLEETKDAVLKTKAQLEGAGVHNPGLALLAAAKQDYYNDSPFTLKDLTSRTNPQQLKADFEAYLDGFSENVQDILNKFKFRNQIPTMLDAGILGAVIEKFVSAPLNLAPYPILNDDGTEKLPALDNHSMGTIFEEILRKFNEENNEEAGEHFTPRDGIELLSDLVLLPIASKIESTAYWLYDGASGTGGMLTIGEQGLSRIARARKKNISVHLFGQEINPETYAITKADMLLRGEGGRKSHIAFGSTLSKDGYPAEAFDFHMSNPPYGKSWKVDLDLLGGKDGIVDPRFVVPWKGETLSMIPRSSDGQLLFLLNHVSKMKEDTKLGSRIAEVNNGSSLFTGDAGSGESNARRYLIERDLVEAIVALPENMFYNTGIGTFVWVLSNRKDEKRRGKIQLIDATEMKVPLRKNMGQKNCAIDEANRAKIMDLFLNLRETPESKIFNNDEFGYWQITVERPLRLSVDVTKPIPANALKPAERTAFDEVKERFVGRVLGWDDFAEESGLKKSILKKIRPLVAYKDSEAVPVMGEADPDLRDTENVPFTYEGGVDAFFEKEVKPYVPDAWVDKDATKIGYEISFTKYFYKPVQLRELADIDADLAAVEKETAQLLRDL